MAVAGLHSSTVLFVVILFSKIKSYIYIVNALNWGGILVKTTYFIFMQCDTVFRCCSLWGCYCNGNSYIFEQRALCALCELWDFFKEILQQCTSFCLFLQSRNSLQQGDIDGAKRLGRLARLLSIVAIVLGLVSIIVYVVVSGTTHSCTLSCWFVIVCGSKKVKCQSVRRHLRSTYLG